MYGRIFYSIMLVAGLVLVASLALTIRLLYAHFSQLQEDQLRDELRSAAVALEKGGASVLGRLAGGHNRLTWVAASGTVLYDSSQDTQHMQNHGARAEIQQTLRTGQGQSLRYSDTLLEKTIYQARRLQDGSVLRISMSSGTVGTLLLQVVQPLLLILVPLLGVAALLARRVSRHILKPINGLDLEHPLENETYAELAPLLHRMEKQKRQIEAQLADLHKKADEFDLMASHMREGLVLLNEKGRIVFLNRAARHIFGTDNQCLGQPLQVLDRRPETEQLMEAAWRTGHSRMRRQCEGRYYHYDVNRIGTQEKALGAILLVVDITEQAFAEQHRREFTANVSHELKTPLQSIMGRAELLENKLVQGKDIQAFAGQIRQEALRLVAMIDDILRLSRLDEGESLGVEDVELLSLAHAGADSLQALAAGKGVRVSVSGQSVHMQGVPRLLEDIISNLCENAIKYNTRGGTVRVRVDRSGDAALLTVEDDGMGIPQEHQARIFERFYRADKSHNRTIAGNGLGLSIVKHAVQVMQGEITVHSAAGAGTRICVSFPLHGPVGGVPQEGLTDAPSRGPAGTDSGTEGWN